MLRLAILYFNVVSLPVFRETILSENLVVHGNRMKIFC